LLEYTGRNKDAYISRAELNRKSRRRNRKSYEGVDWNGTKGNAENRTCKDNSRNRIVYVTGQEAQNMIDPSCNPVTQRHADYSSTEMFLFCFFCDLCGKEWKSARYDFNPGSIAKPIDLTVYQMLWNEQHRAAYERANRDASFEFNRCPVCGRRVCKECFHLSETGISDICIDCLKEQGT